MYDDIISTYSVQFNVPEPWIRGVIQTESSFNPNAYRAEPQINDASYGLMQLLYKTAQGLGYVGDPNGLFDPDTNIMLGTKLLGQLRVKYGDDVNAIYSAYNSGSPTKYLTSSQVNTNVSHFIKNLESFIKSEPLVAASGGVGALIVLVLLWFWTKKGK